MINFGAGPAAIPSVVKAAFKDAIDNVEGSGYSIFELPHRSEAFAAILEELNMLAKKLLHLPDNFDIVWMQGGGRHQFAMIPMNFLPTNGVAGYLDSGYWSHDAMQHAQIYGKTMCVGSSKADNYQYIPQINWTALSDLNYVHLTTNNTIYGTQINELPITPVPLIADMSSDIFSRKIDAQRCSMLYAVAQKNIGISGVTMVAIDRNFAQQGNADLPEILKYQSFIQHNSLINTAPVAVIYSCLLMLRHYDAIGIENIHAQNIAKAQLLYDFIGQNPHMHLLPISDLSNMNICFRLTNAQHDAQLIAFAREHNILGIEGHRRIGGLRVSMYNNTTFQDVEELMTILSKYNQIHY